MPQKKTHILYALLICICISLSFSASAEGITPKQAYHQAESCQKELRNSAQRMKYRDNWLRCIEKFQEVYRLEPDGPWAPAGLYMSGNLYQELARYSAKESDLRESRDIYERIISRYPASRYRNKAALKLNGLAASLNADKKSGAIESVQASAPSTDEEYQAAESCYSNLRQSAAKMKYRDNWLQCIDKYYTVYRNDPGGPQAAAGLFMTGKLYADLYDHSRRKSDLQAAQTMYERVIEKFADSRFKVKAELLIEAMPSWVQKNSPSQGDDN
jgi:N-acetylmuramoyl-L-alanine amidase